MPSAAADRQPLSAAGAPATPACGARTTRTATTATRRRGLFMVIDGVGGQAAGEKAAETALAMIRARLERETGAPGDRVREAITLANNEIVPARRERAGVARAWRAC